MVLRHSGRVGRRRFPQAPRSLSRSRGLFYGSAPDGFAELWGPAPGLAPCRGGRRRAAILFSNDELWGKALRIQKLVLYSIGLIEYVYRDCIWAYFISIWYYSINSEVACLMLNPLSSRFDGLGIVHWDVCCLWLSHLTIQLFHVLMYPVPETNAKTRSNKYSTIICTIIQRQLFCYLANLLLMPWQSQHQQQSLIPLFVMLFYLHWFVAYYVEWGVFNNELCYAIIKHFKFWNNEKNACTNKN